MAKKTKRKAKSGLTARQRRFVSEYMIDLNGTRAAMRAGYCERTARFQASRLLTKSNIIAALEKKRAAQEQRAEVTADDVVRELALIAFSDIGETLDFSGDALCTKSPSEIPERARKALASVKIRRERSAISRTEEPEVVELVEFKLWSKLDALRELALHLPGFRAPQRVAPTDPSGEKQFTGGIALLPAPANDPESWGEIAKRYQQGLGREKPA